MCILGCGPETQTFIISATVASFYVPLLIMTVMYALTVQALRRQLREQRSMTVNQLGAYSRDYRAGGGGGLRRLDSPAGRPEIWNTATSSGIGTPQVETTLFTSSASDLASAVDAYSARRRQPAGVDQDRGTTKPGRSGCFSADSRQARGRRTGAPMQATDRGRRAVRVLGILFAVFVLFYLPFFAAYIVHGTCQSCQPYISPQTITAFEWLQYSGSMVNPVVYHVFNPDFRRAFIKILRCRSAA